MTYKLHMDYYTRESYPPWGGWQAHADKLKREVRFPTMDLKAAAFITLWAVPYRTVECPECLGAGGDRYYTGHGDHYSETCPGCGGTGIVPVLGTQAAPVCKICGGDCGQCGGPC